MPTRKTNSRIKNRDQYEALCEQGASKEKAARIAHSGREPSVKGGKNPKYKDWTKSGNKKLFQIE